MTLILEKKPPLLSSQNAKRGASNKPIGHTSAVSNIRLLGKKVMKIREAEVDTSLAEWLRESEEVCQNCRPITPMICITQCRFWKLKNEFRKYHEKIANNGYFTTLLNSLKNKRRLEILNILSKQPFKLVRLQQKLTARGCYHSQGTIVKEYVEPLIEVGLVDENSGVYHATMFGCGINNLIKDFHKVERFLQPHSKCYEETVLLALLDGQKTYEELKLMIPTESLKRVMARLLKARLIVKNGGNNYIFYFKTKRDLRKESVSQTERRVYQNIPEEGMTAEKLADKANISLRRAYKYLRKLRGKKLVFKRKCPATYSLTTEGMQIAGLLDRIRALVAEFMEASVEITAKSLETVPLIPCWTLLKQK